MPVDESGKNLSGRSFREKDLSGADFSGSDISGADFTNAVLAGANFSGAKSGQQTSWLIALCLILVLPAFLAGLIIAYGGAVIGSLMVQIQGQPATFWFGIIALVYLLIFWAIVATKGFGIELGAYLAIGLATVILVAAMTTSGDVAAAALVHFFAVIAEIPGVLLATIVLASARILGGSRALLLLLIVILAGCALGAYQGVEGLGVTDESYGYFVAIALTVSGAVSVALVAFSLFLSSRLFEDDQRFGLLRGIVTSISSYRGTSFKGATLTGANFSGAKLKSADFRGAILKTTNWSGAELLEYSRFDETNLDDFRLRKLVTTKQGTGENFDRADLRGLNLEEANLARASFVGADLNNTDLSGADLQGAKLAKAQLYQANLTNADITGAFIQDWGISSKTKFKDVKCDYLFMRLPTEGNPEPWRKPANANENFEAGDFAKFISPIVQTLDYYASQDSDPHKTADDFKLLDIFHNKAIDPNAFAVAIQQFSEENPEADLEVVAVEGNEGDQLRLQAKISNEVDGEALRGEYLRKYEEINSKSDSEIQELIFENQAFKSHIQSLEKLVETALQQKGVNITNLEGGLVMKEVQQELNISGSTIHGDINQVAADSISDSFKKAENAENPELREKLQELSEQIAELCKKLPADKQEQVAQDLKVLTDEATSKEPREQWYTLGANALIKTAGSVAEMAAPIAATVKAIVSLLQ